MLSSGGCPAWLGEMVMVVVFPIGVVKGADDLREWNWNYRRGRREQCLLYYLHEIWLVMSSFYELQSYFFSIYAYPGLGHLFLNDGLPDTCRP